MPPATWMKAGRASQQAHKIEKAGNRLLVTACKVAIHKDQAVPANTTTQRCWECLEKSNVKED